MSAKIGRNDLCLCGSGKKYKFCCLDKSTFGAELYDSGRFPQFDRESEAALLDEGSIGKYRDLVEGRNGNKGIEPDDPGPTYMEFRGTPNPATDALNGLKRVLAQHHFSSKSEADDFIAQHMEGINYQAKPDFHGLSSDRMRRLLAAEELDGLEDMVELNDHLPVEQTRTAWLPSIAAHILNLHRAAPKGVGLTSTGNYKPAVVHAVWEHFYPDADKGRAPRNEDQFRELRLVHDFLAERYFTEENTTTSRLSGEGRILAEEPDPNRLWRELFEYMLYTYDWQEPVMEILAFPEHRFIQESGLFSLLLLRDMAKDFIGISEAYKEFTVAFPYQTNGLRQAGQFNSFNIYLFMYKHLFVDNFCADLGLIEYETPFPRGQLPTPPERFRASSLLNQVLRWKI